MRTFLEAFQQLRTDALRNPSHSQWLVSKEDLLTAEGLRGTLKTFKANTSTGPRALALKELRQLPDYSR